MNLASVAGIRGGNPHLLYPTSKGAIVNMTRAMAHQHAKEEIRVNCVYARRRAKSRAWMLTVLVAAQAWSILP